MDEEADQRRDAMLLRALKMPPESNADFKARLKSERGEKEGREPHQPAPEG